MHNDMEVMLHKPRLLWIYFDFLNFFSKGIPDQRALGGCSIKLPPDPLPEAADCYHWQVGFSLTQVSLFHCFPQWSMKQQLNKNAMRTFLNSDSAVNNEPGHFKHKD